MILEDVAPGDLYLIDTNEGTRTGRIIANDGEGNFSFILDDNTTVTIAFDKILDFA